MEDQSLYQKPVGVEELNKEAKKFEKSFCGFFIHNYRFAILIIIAILLFGSIALSSLPREAEPEVQVPIGIVTTVYSGASPADVEKLITNKMEDELKNLENVKTITSSSGNSVSSVVIEYVAEADLETSIRKLKDAVDNVKPDLPDEAEDPMVSEIRFSDIPIITFSLQGDFAQTELNNYSKLLKDELETIPGASKATRIGNLKRQFRVTINKEKLEGLGIGISSVVNAIALNNINLPIGDLEIDNVNYQLRAKGEIDNYQDLAEIPVTTAGGTIIKLSDIAEVKDFFEDQETISRLSLSGQPAYPTVSLQLYKKTGGNILNIIKEAKDKIESLKTDNVLPSNLNIITTNDNSQFVADDLSRLGQNAVTTVIIIFIILMFVLGWREALIAGTSIPLAFLSAFLLIKLQGETLNSMVLFSLVLALGLLVDNIIVILEGIYDNINRRKMANYEGTLLAVKQFFWPVTSGTMTTVAAFAPMLLVSGIMGEYMGIIPKTVSSVLLSALFISLTLIPAIAVKLLVKNKIARHKNHDNSNGHCNKCSAFTKIRRKIRDHFTEAVYKIKAKHVKLLENVLPNKKSRRKFIIASWILFFIFTSFPFIGVLQVEMFPKIDIDYFFISVKTPQGSSLEVTEKVVKKVENILYQNKYVDNFLSSIGSNLQLGGYSNLGPSGGGSADKASITVNLVDDKKRDLKSYEITELIRPELEKITEADVKIEELTAGPPSGKPVEVRLTGEDLNILEDIANMVMDELKQIEGAVDIEKSTKDATGEFVLYPKEDVLAEYGLTNLTFASALRQTIYGIDASEINLNNEDVKINVSLSDKQLASINDVENMLIPTPSGQRVLLSNLAETEFQPSLVSIGHQDGSRIVTVSANTQDATAQQIFEKLQKRMETKNLPSGYRVEYGGEMEDIQQSFTEIFLSFFVALVLIAGILVLQFNSFKQPLIIMSTLPLAMIGVFFGLSLLRLQFSLPAFIGIVGLAGIVVNDAIILIDKINQNIYSYKMQLKEAIIEASQSRMQPIFLTTITTVAGILPLGLTDPMWAGLAFSIIFGLTFATFLTLVMVPIIYVSLEGKRVTKFFKGEISRD